MPFSELFLKIYFYEYYTIRTVFLLHPCACAFVRPARRCVLPGSAGSKGARIPSPRWVQVHMDKPEKWWVRPWNLLGFCATASVTRSRPGPQRTDHPGRCLAWDPDAEKTDATTTVKNLWLRVSKLGPASNRTLGGHWYGVCACGLYSKNIHLLFYLLCIFTLKDSVAINCHCPLLIRDGSMGLISCLH